MTTNTARRVDLDLIKGFAMILVILCHNYHFALGYWGTIYKWADVFQITLFVFVSGYLCKPIKSFSKDSISRYFTGKATRLLLPLLIIPALFNLIIQKDWHTMLMSNMHGGYWFTYVLMIMFAVFFLFQFINSKANKNDNVWVEVVFHL